MSHIHRGAQRTSGTPRGRSVSGQPRDQIADVGRSARAVMSAACTADPPLKAAEHRVLLAVLHETSTWTRHVDALSVARIVDLSGLRRRGVLEVLPALATRGLIVYQARPGRPRAGEYGRCRIGIPDVNVLPVDVPTTPEMVPPAPHRFDRQPATGNGAPRPAPKTPKTVPPGGHIPEESFPEEKNSSSPDVPTQLAMSPVAVGGGGAIDNDDQTGSADVRQVLDAVTRMVGAGRRTEMAVRSRIVELLAAGYRPDEITRHVETRTATGRTRGTITDPAGLLAHVLADVPPSAAARRAVVEQTRAATAAEQAAQRDAASASDVAAARSRHERVTAALGTALHARLVDAELARSRIGGGRRSPDRIRRLAAGVYERHDWDPNRIRAYAESLPAGPAESLVEPADTNGANRSHQTAGDRPSPAILAALPNRRLA